MHFISSTLDRFLNNWQGKIKGWLGEHVAASELLYDNNHTSSSISFGCIIKFLIKDLGVKFCHSEEWGMTLTYRFRDPYHNAGIFAIIQINWDL